jgi:hypothetical protein
VKFRKTSLLALSAAAMALLVSACSTCVGISPSTTPITENDSYVVIGKAKGTSSGVVWFIVPTFPDNQSELARNDALKSSGADALIEVTEEYRVSTFLLFSFVKTTVQGTAVKIKRGGAL